MKRESTSGKKWSAQSTMRKTTASREATSESPGIASNVYSCLIKKRQERRL